MHCVYGMCYISNLYITLFLFNSRVQVSVPDSCDRRFGHSMSTLWLEPHRVWLFVFGGLRSLLSGAVACTTIIEMSKGSSSS